MATGLSFVKWWLGDYAKKTGDLSLIQHGAYRMLLDYYFTKAEITPAGSWGLPFSPEKLLRAARAVTNAEIQAVEDVVKEFFDLAAQPGYMLHHKANEVIIDAIKSSGAQRSKAEKRWGQRPAAPAVEDAGARAAADASRDAGADASQSQSHSHTEQEQNPLPPSGVGATGGKPKRKRAAAKAVMPGKQQYTPEFELWWKAYPSGSPKLPAFQRWETMTADMSPADILLLAQLVQANVQLRVAEDTQWAAGFVPHAATFLNQRRYNEPPDRRPRAGKPQRASTERNNDKTAADWADKGNGNG